MPIAAGMLPSFSRQIGPALGVASSSRVTINCPIGLSYDKIVIALTNITIANCTNIKMRINGADIQSWDSGTQMELVNSYLDQEYTTVAGYLVFDFCRMGVQNPGLRAQTRIGTGAPPVANQITAATMDISFDLPAGLTNPAVSAYAILYDAAPLGLVRQVRTFAVVPGATGVFDWNDLPRTQIIEWIGFDISSGVFDSVKLLMNGQQWRDGSNTIWNDFATNGFRRPQTNWFFLDWDQYGDGTKVLDARQATDLTLRMNITTANTIKIVVGMLGAPSI